MDSLAHLGQTRSTRQPTHLLHTPDAFVRTPLPDLVGGEAIVHAAPALGAGVLQYTAEIAPKGKLLPATQQRFVYLLAGEAHLIGPQLDRTIHAGAFLYLPTAHPTTLIATTECRCAIIEKRYEPLPGVPAPAAFVGYEDAIPAQPLNLPDALSRSAVANEVRSHDVGILVRPLLPPDAAFDFAVNTMTYTPGASLPQVEVHVMEHGLLMLEGGGVYRLGEQWYAVQAGDFIWIAPFCPQWFGALGRSPAKYLIYKDFNRTPRL